MKRSLGYTDIYKFSTICCRDPHLYLLYSYSRTTQLIKCMLIYRKPLVQSALRCVVVLVTKKVKLNTLLDLLTL